MQLFKEHAGLKMGNGFGSIHPQLDSSIEQLGPGRYCEMLHFFF